LPAAARFSEHRQRARPTDAGTLQSPGWIRWKPRPLRYNTKHTTLEDLRATCSAPTTSLQVFFGLPLCLAPSISYSIHFFPNHCLLFAAHTYTVATCFAVKPTYNFHLFLVSLSLNFLLATLSFTLTSHIHLTILISAR